MFFLNLLIAEFFNCHNDIHSNLHSQISSVVVFNDHDGTVVDQNKIGQSVTSDSFTIQRFVWCNWDVCVSDYNLI
jgi:hypothetical protein